MKSRLNLKPGQKGTKKYVDKYGASLVYVRHRYDEELGIRRTTVELVEEEVSWQPRKRRHDSDLVAVAVAFAEQELRETLKGAGGRWDPERKVWVVPYGAIRGTELAERIMAREAREAGILNRMPSEYPGILNRMPRGIFFRLLQMHPIRDAKSYMRCFSSDKCSIWEDHRFTRAREPVNK